MVSLKQDLKQAVSGQERLYLNALVNQSLKREADKRTRQQYRRGNQVLPASMRGRVSDRRDEWSRPSRRSIFDISGPVMKAAEVTTLPDEVTTFELRVNDQFYTRQTLEYKRLQDLKEIASRYNIAANKEKSKLIEEILEQQAMM